MAHPYPARSGATRPLRRPLAAAADTSRQHRSEAQIAAALLAHVDQVRDTVARQGWTTQPVLGDIPYCYTVGLSMRPLSGEACEEVLISGLPPDVACAVLDHVARRVLDGKLQPSEGTVFGEVFQGVPAQFRKMTARHAEAALRLACALGETQAIGGWQLLWPDARGRFPGDPECAPEAAHAQDLEAALAVELRP